MSLRKLSLLAAGVGMAFCTNVLAQTPPSSPPTSPSTGIGATPGGIPPSTTTPAPIPPGPGAGGTTTRPGPGGTVTPGNPGAMDFTAVDADRDGYISRAEASRFSLGGQFATLDKNNDGRLDRSEFSVHGSDTGRAPGMQSGTAPSGGTRTQ
jgi:hypothetical protein